jgi:hypothetical protein
VRCLTYSSTFKGTKLSLRKRYEYSDIVIHVSRIQVGTSYQTSAALSSLCGHACRYGYSFLRDLAILSTYFRFPFTSCKYLIHAFEYKFTITIKNIIQNNFLMTGHCFALILHEHTGFGIRLLNAMYRLINGFIMKM